MWNLAVYFPVMIGSLVPDHDEEWGCFLLLLDILQICVSCIVSTDLMGYLSDLISVYLSSFRECYPHLNITPKEVAEYYYIMNIVIIIITKKIILK